MVTMNRGRIIGAALLLLLQSTYSFVVTHTQHNKAGVSSRIDTEVHATDAPSNGIELVSLASLGDDHEAVGESIAKSLADWLDDEWMPQEVHIRMGVSVKNTYITCRNNGIDDIASIMTDCTDDLYERWSEYDADAFINAWDVGNYVSDFLIAKSGSETCGCSTKIE